MRAWPPVGFGGQLLGSYGQPVGQWVAMAGWRLVLRDVLFSF